MAYRKVSDESLQSVADAIRAKAGTSETMEFPIGFVSAIGGIEAGGESAETEAMQAAGVDEAIGILTGAED